MKAVLLRTTSGSSPTQASIGFCSPRGSFSDHDHGTGISFSGRNTTPSPRSALHFEMKDRSWIPTSFRRALSDTDLIRTEKASSGRFRALNRVFSRSVPARISEEQDLSEESVDLQSEMGEDEGSLMSKWKSFDLGVSDRISGISHEELEFPSGGMGMGKGRKVGGGGDGTGDFTSGSGDQNKIGAYYQEMLKLDPGNPLLLRNYGKYLHEVENDLERAEEYYGRAILASPGDAEVLSLYGKLTWETHKDQGRAKSYFDQAIQAAPDNCYVLGSYAQFMWDVAEDDEEEEGPGEERNVDGKSPTLVEAC
ncbi:uncharacterized protein LOC131248012 [Magnolia sinica]|uniref:uncharacterized protein LOC131248012 n=1 Tax=Magnolia sinica TaxID=86752 RepID=UPI00265AD152|nr:uncharacterized protein LOC131248012 [Magnolia sinica]